MSHVRSIIAEVRGTQAPWIAPILDRAPEQLTPRRHLSDRRRVELALPALIAKRLVEVMIPVGGDEQKLVSNAKVVFHAVALEAMDDLPEKDRTPLLRRAILLRAWLLDPYADQKRGALTVMSAFTLWLDDLCARGALEIDTEGAFYKCWDAISDGILRHPSNVESLERCSRSAGKMAAEWRNRLSRRGYFTEVAHG